MSSVSKEHRSQSPASVRCAVVTVSDTRTIENDVGGATVVEWLEKFGHAVAAREIIKDDPAPMEKLVRELAARDDVQAILLTGGTGLNARDQTFETISALLQKPLPGYGELFRMLSYQEIGAAAMLSRAVGGVLAGKIVLTMPGSPAGVRLAMEKLIAPELGHLVREAGK